MVERMFQKPNLKENKIDTLNFSAKLELGTEVNNLIKEQGALVGRAYVFIESYTIARVKHTFTIQFDFSSKFSTESRKTVPETEVTFKFRLTPGAKVPKTFSIPNNIIEALSKIETTSSFDCAIDYDYKNQYKRKFVLDLPINIPQSKIFPFKIIDGVSIAGKIENIDYSTLIVNYPRQKTTRLMIMFEKNYHFNGHIAEKIINDANMIANRLMVSSGV
jgi:hypothetical protein